MGQHQAAQAAVFMFSALAAGMTGSALAADGGLSAETQTSLEGL
jgi:enoyl-[acyl-carrier-protein] reductase (NADH)